MKQANNQCMPCSLDFKKEIENICSILRKPIPNKGFSLFTKYNRNRDILTGCSKKFICSDIPYLSQFVLFSHENKTSTAISANERKETAEELNLNLNENELSSCPDLTNYESPKQIREELLNFKPSPWASTYQVYMSPERQSRPILPRFRNPPEECKPKERMKSSLMRKFQFNLESEERTFVNKSDKSTQVIWHIDLNSSLDLSSYNESSEETLLDSDITFYSSKQYFEGDWIYCPGRRAKREKAFALEEEITSSSREFKEIIKPKSVIKSPKHIRISENYMEKETEDVQRIVDLFTPLITVDMTDSPPPFVISSTSDVFSLNDQYEHEETPTSHQICEEDYPPPPPPSIVSVEYTKSEMVNSEILNKMLMLLCEKATQTDWIKDVYEILYANNE